MISYEELVAGLEDAWVIAGLHDHNLVESFAPGTMERIYRAELFPEHPEPMTSIPPWVEVSFNWCPTHQLLADGQPLPPIMVELSWTYTVEIPNPLERTDLELARAFQSSVRAALRRLVPDITTPADYVLVEVRRGYHSVGDRPAPTYVQLVGTSSTDLTDMWSDRTPDGLRNALRDELQIVAALLRALGETFAPGGMGNYRSVDTA
ncbi:MAG: hypothetical protein OHK0022_24840 [Roseiflexaceae bacterium]